ncbi:MAG: serine O-acetyltransferase [Clostridia bacterium]|nr:serine O-acetyltransferase [Clostridia bacterium]MBR6754810.1 serine O-acetyltransferase [Clostridia bacterium]
MTNNDLIRQAEQFEKRIRILKSKANSFFGELGSEVRSIRERDPAARTDAEVLLLYPGLHAVLAHRLANSLYKRELFFAARAVSQAARNATGIEIHPAATIGKGLFIDHGCAVVIGETTIIGDNCTIYQGVTLGGTGKHEGKRHPTIGNNVMVGAGAKVLGPVVVGDNSKIAAGAVVLKDIPENSTAVGIPARVVRGKTVEKVQTLDQIHIPDPVAQEINLLKERIAELEKKLDER